MVLQQTRQTGAVGSLTVLSYIYSGLPLAELKRRETIKVRSFEVEKMGRWEERSANMNKYL